MPPQPPARLEQVEPTACIKHGLLAERTASAGAAVGDAARLAVDALEREAQPVLENSARQVGTTLEIAESRDPYLRQTSDTFDVVYQQAEQAQTKLTGAVATEWVPDKKLSFMRHPAEGKKMDWVDGADDPGVKGIDRAREKMEKDYGGDASKLKDLARMTLVYKNCSRMASALIELKHAGFEIVQCKNKYASPSPLGYSDLNLCLRVPLGNETTFVCEMQINHERMIEAKMYAHDYYEVVQGMIRKICADCGLQDDKKKDDKKKPLPPAPEEEAYRLLGLAEGRREHAAFPSPVTWLSGRPIYPTFK